MMEDLGMAALPAALRTAMEQRFSGMRLVMDGEEHAAGDDMTSGRQFDRNGVLGILSLKRLSVAPGEDAGIWRLAMQALFSLRLHLAEDMSVSSSWRLLEEMVAFIHQQRWQRRVGAATVIECVREFSDQVGTATVAGASWRIDWLQLLYLARDPEEAAVPVIGLHAGQAPRIGRAHETDYIRLEVSS